MKLFTKKQIIIGIVSACAVLILCVGLAATAVALGGQTAILKARISHLEMAVRFQGVDPVELDSLEARINALGTITEPDTSRITELYSRVAKLESRLAYPVVGSTTLKDYYNQFVVLYGTVTRVTKASTGHLYLDIDSGATAVWFNCPYSKTDLGIDVGYGICIYGKAGEYQGKPQVVFEGRESYFSSK